ncbi:MAG: hypothetical protein KH349_03595 [Clostridium sp.]|nr:hypothetical protein [Clostridium sp.]
MKSDDAMFCLPAKAMRLWRDVCFRHVADKKTPRSGVLIISLKRREFDEIVVFSAGSEKPSVLSVHDFSGSAEKAKYRKLSPFHLVLYSLRAFAN